MTFQRGDTCMPTDVDPVPFQRFNVALPPLLHDQFSLEMRDRQRDRNLFLAEHLVKEAIVALHGRRHPVPAYAKQKETDSARGVQPLYQLRRLLDRTRVPIRPSLRFLQSDGIPEPDRRRAELELILCRREGACDAVWRDVGDVPPCEEIDERTFADAGFPEEDDVEVLRGGATWSEGVVDDEVADDALTLVATPRGRRMCVVRKGGDAGVCGECHVEI